MSIGPGFLIEFIFRSIGGCKPTVFEGARGLHCEPASAVAVSTSWAFGYLDCFFRWRYHERSLRHLHPESYILKLLLFLQCVLCRPNACMCSPKPLKLLAQSIIHETMTSFHSSHGPGSSPATAALSAQTPAARSWPGGSPCCSTGRAPPLPSGPSFATALSHSVRRLCSTP